MCPSIVSLSRTLETFCMESSDFYKTLVLWCVCVCERERDVWSVCTCTCHHEGFNKSGLPCHCSVRLLMNLQQMFTLLQSTFMTSSVVKHFQKAAVMKGVPAAGCVGYGGADNMKGSWFKCWSPAPVHVLRRLQQQLHLNLQVNRRVQKLLFLGFIWVLSAHRGSL